MTDVPESMEAQVEHVRRSASGVSDYHLDEQLAVSVARRDVAAAHGLSSVAAVWQDVALALDDVRRARTRVRAEIEDMTGPPIFMRPLTAAELDDCEWPEEPPC